MTRKRKPAKVFSLGVLIAIAALFVVAFSANRVMAQAENYDWCDNIIQAPSTNPSPTQSTNAGCHCDPIESYFGIYGCRVSANLLSPTPCIMSTMPQAGVTMKASPQPVGLLDNWKCLSGLASSVVKCVANVLTTLTAGSKADTLKASGDLLKTCGESIGDLIKDCSDPCGWAICVARTETETYIAASNPQKSCK